MSAARDEVALVRRLVSVPLRLRLAAAAALGGVELASIALTARLLVEGGRSASAIVALGAALAALLRGVLGVGSRLALQERLHLAVVDAALAGDVLESSLGAPSDDDAVFDGVQHGAAVVAVTGPRVVAAAVALPVAVSLVAAPLGAQLGALVAAVALAMGAGTVWAQRSVRDSEARSWRAFEPVLESFTSALRGRVEIVALGAEHRVTDDVRRRLACWSAVARASEVVAALVARVPLAIGLSTVAAVVAFAYRDLTELAARGALALAVLPAASELARSVTELARARARHRTFLALLSAPRRAGEGATDPARVADVVVEEASFAYGARSTPSVRGVSFAWRAGTVLVLRGPNGAGKSTVLRAVLGLVRCVDGRLVLGGVDAGVVAWSRWRRRCALLVQEPFVRPGMRVGELATWLLDDKPSDDAISEALAFVGVGHGLDADALRLSVGERRRVVLARVLLHGAATHVLLDEPDASLDALGVATVRAVVERLRANGVAVAVATHDRELAEVADVVVDLGVTGSASG